MTTWTESGFKPTSSLSLNKFGIYKMIPLKYAGYLNRVIIPDESIVLQDNSYGPTSWLKSGTVRLPFESDVKYNVAYGPSDTLIGTLAVTQGTVTAVESWS